MFQDTDVYNATNLVPRRTALDSLQNHHKHLSYTGNDLILDVGSGSGNVTCEVLLPFVPHRNFRMVGVDKLKSMVDFANENFKCSNISFRVLDITEKNEERLKSVFSDEELKLGFNIVFSFNCLQYIRDYPQCYKNIFSLMRPGGQLFTFNVAYCIIGDVWKSVHKLEKWQPYLKDITDFLFPYHDCKDVVKTCTDMLKKIGFQDIKCYHEPKLALPEGLPKPPMRTVLEYLDPFLHAIPQSKRSEYMEDVMAFYDLEMKKNPGLPFNGLTVIATKPL